MSVIIVHITIQTMLQLQQLTTIIITIIQHQLTPMVKTLHPPQPLTPTGSVGQLVSMLIVKYHRFMASEWSRCSGSSVVIPIPLQCNGYFFRIHKTLNTIQRWSSVKSMQIPISLLIVSFSSGKLIVQFNHLSNWTFEFIDFSCYSNNSSGLLVGLSVFKELRRKGRINYLQFYLHRYLRMTPLMMIIIGFCVNLLKYMGSGPSWSESTTMFDQWCQNNWWINSLYLHNFINRENMVSVFIIIKLIRFFCNNQLIIINF